MQKFIIIFLSLILVGCTRSRLSLDPAQISANHTSKLNTEKVWPLKNKGNYLQKVTATFMGKQYQFSVHLTMDEGMLEAIAFNDMAGRLYTLKWTPEEVIWNGSPFIPAIIKPENIIEDFLMAHLPAEELQNALSGSQVIEKSEKSSKTRTVRLRKVLRTITYSKPIGSMWERVVIENPIVGYKLDIHTLEQK